MSVIDIPPGGDVTIELEIDGPFDAKDGYDLIVPVQPTVADDDLSVEVQAPGWEVDGDNVFRFSDETSVDQRFDLQLRRG